MPLKHTDKVLLGITELVVAVQTTMTAGYLWLCLLPSSPAPQTDRVLSLANTSTIIPWSETQRNTKTKIKTCFKTTAGHQ